MHISVCLRLASDERSGLNVIHGSVYGRIMRVRSPVSANCASAEFLRMLCNKRGMPSKRGVRTRTSRQSMLTREIRLT